MKRRFLLVGLLFTVLFAQAPPAAPGEGADTFFRASPSVLRNPGAPARVPAPAGPSPESLGDSATIFRDDRCFYRNLALVKGRNLITGSMCGDPSYDNGPEDYVAIMINPEEFVHGPTFQVDRVEILFTEPFAEGRTFPSIRLCPSVTGPGPVPPEDTEPDLGACLAEQLDFTVSFATDPANSFEFAYVPVPALGGTVITSMARPFWIVLHLPPGECGGLPFDCGMLRNCPDYIDGTTGYREVHASYRWRNVKVYSADDPISPGQWLGPLRTQCSDGVTTHYMNGLVNVTVSDVTASDDDLMPWNQTILDAVITCAPDGVFSDLYIVPAPCPDPAVLSPNSDLQFLVDFVVNGTMGVPLASIEWNIYNQDTDPSHLSPLFTLTAAYNSRGYSSCVETDPSTWQPGCGLPDGLVQLIPQASTLSFLSERVPADGNYEACLRILHAHCDFTPFSPEPDEFSLDNWYDSDPTGPPSACIPFTVGSSGSPCAPVKRIVPTRGSNVGLVGAVIHGCAFEEGTSVRLVCAGYPDIPGEQVRVASDGKSLSAVFDLLGAPGGKRDVIVELGPGPSMLPGAFTVEEGMPPLPPGAPYLWFDLNGPKRLRAREPGHFQLDYRNHGGVDMDAPLMVLYSRDGGRFMAADGVRFHDNSIRVMALGSTGHPGRLIPHATHHMSFLAHSPLGPDHITIEAALLTPEYKSFEWDRFALEGLPENADPTDWALRVSQARPLMGESWEEVLSTLRTVADQPGVAPHALFGFDRLLVYTVALYGSSIEELTESAPSAPPASALGDLDPAQVKLVTVQKVASPTQTFVVTHGLGGLCQDAHDACVCGDPCNPDTGCVPDRFHQLGEEIRNTHPAANVYIVDWSAGSEKYVTMGGRNVPWPWTAALNVDIAAEAAYNLLQAEGIDPAKTTLIGEDLGVHVNSQMTARLHRVDAALAFNPPSEIGGRLNQYNPTSRSHAFHTDNPLDLQDVIAGCDFLLETPPDMGIPDRHTWGIRWLTERICAADMKWLDATVACEKPARIGCFHTGTAMLNGDSDDERVLCPTDALDSWADGLAVEEPAVRVVEIRGSIDPNGKEGLEGFGAERYIRGDSGLPYVIHFENLAAATAPAAEVVIEDQLDCSVADLASFSLGSLGFGDTVVAPIVGTTDWYAEVDLRPRTNLIVRVQVNVRTDTGKVTWRFMSIDPDTGLPPTDPDVGFLPPNVEPPEGQGFVSFFVDPLPSDATGDAIPNQATIVFDSNPPMDTPVWTNTLDRTGPESEVTAHTPTTSCAGFRVEWSGTDQGSGIRDYSIFVSEDGGPFTLWLDRTTETRATFYGTEGKTYAFYSTARDNVGFVEYPPAIPDASTRVQASMAAIGNSLTLRKTGAGGLEARFQDLATAPDDYVLIGSTEPSGSAFTVQGSGPDGATGISLPALPPDPLMFYHVAGRELPDCIGPI